MIDAKSYTNSVVRQYSSGRVVYNPNTNAGWEDTSELHWSEHCPQRITSQSTWTSTGTSKKKSDPLGKDSFTTPQEMATELGVSVEEVKRIYYSFKSKKSHLRIYERTARTIREKYWQSLTAESSK